MGHDDDALVSPGSSDHGQANAGVSRRAFDDRGARWVDVPCVAKSVQPMKIQSL